MPKDKKLNTSILILSLLLLVAFITHFRWLTFKILTYSDYYYYFRETVTEWFNPGTWSIVSTFGREDPIIWRYPFRLVFGILARSGLEFPVIGFFLSFLPALVVNIVASFLLLSKYLKSQFGVIVGVTVFSFNTYFLSINTQGHFSLTISAGLGVLSLWLFTESLDKHSFIYSLYTSLALFICGFYDMRYLYITVVLLILYVLYEMILNKNFIWFTRSWFYFLMRSVSPFVFLLPLLAYWLLLGFNRGSLLSNRIQDRAIFGTEFWSLRDSLLLFHPFWTGGKVEWFVVHNPPLYFWVIPLLVILGLLLGKKNKYNLYFGLVFLFGVFFAKGVNPPFESMYPWLYRNFPGFNAFRDASKFYFPIALGASFLIGSFVDWILNNGKIFPYKKFSAYIVSSVIALIFLINLKPILTGEIETLFVPRKLPNDYIVFKNSLSGQEEYFRTLWVPAFSKWGFYNNNHPKVSTVDITNSDWKRFIVSEGNEVPLSIREEIAGLFQKSYSDELLDEASIKYVVVPIEDTENDDNFFVYYGKSRKFFIDNLDSVSYLKRIDAGTDKLVVYENTDFKPHIYASLVGGEVGYIPLDNIRSYGPEQYEINIKGLKERTYVHFSDNYNSGWGIGLGEFNRLESFYHGGNFIDDSFHSRSYGGFNTFLLDPGYIKKWMDPASFHENPDGSLDLKLTIYFRPQRYMYLGLIISASTLALILFYLVFAYVTRKKPG